MNEQIQAIRAEVERRLNEITIKVGEARPRLHGKRRAYLDVLGIIDSLPEEKPEDFSDAFDKYMKEEWSHGTQLNDIARHFYKLGQASVRMPEEQPSKDLEEAAEKKYPVYWKEYPKDGIARSESFYDTNAQCRDAFIAGAKWQKKQDTADMLKSDFTVFNKCYEQGKKDIISIIESRISEIIGDAQPKPVLRAELQELIKRIKEEQQ